jgi:hypothetical protein
MRYRVETIVKYTNSQEYRQCCRELFDMNTEIYEKNIENIENHNQEKLDQESWDEMAYDAGAISAMLDYVYECTKNINEFDELYKMAARRMLSEDANIGLSILFSYDYMQLFHLCLVEFFNDKLNKDSEPYRELVKQMS